MLRMTSAVFLLAGLFLATTEPSNAQPNNQDGPGMMYGMGMGGMGGSGMSGSGMSGMMGMGFGMGGMPGTPPPFMMHHSWFSPGNMGGCFMATGENGAFPNIDERMNFIQLSLSITDAQRPQWEGFVNAIRRSQETMQMTYQTMMGNMMNMNFVERFNQQLTAMNTHMAALQKVAPALAAFYGVLTPEQKTRADGLFRSMGCFI